MAVADHHAGASLFLGFLQLSIGNPFEKKRLRIVRSRRHILRGLLHGMGWPAIYFRCGFRSHRQGD